MHLNGCKDSGYAALLDDSCHTIKACEFAGSVDLTGRGVGCHEDLIAL